MKKYINSIATIILSILMPILLFACGGGGGGNGGGDDGGISYSGITIQAIITDSNALDITIGAYQGGKTGSALSDVGVTGTYENDQIARPRVSGVSQALETALHKADISSYSGGIDSGAAQSESRRIYGDCGGYADVTVTYDDVTGDFNGSMNFSGFCSDNVFISGKTSFSGRLNVGTGDLINFTFSFNDLTGSMGSDSISLKGTISINAATSPVIITMNMLLQDNSSGKVYRLENYEMTMTGGSGYVDIIISGRYYDPDYGYVVISTSTPLKIYDGDYWPSQGSLICTGDLGTDGGNTTAQLNALSSSQYEVKADTDGDGLYDWSSGVKIWD